MGKDTHYPLPKIMRTRWGVPVLAFPYSYPATGNNSFRPLPASTPLLPSLEESMQSLIMRTRWGKGSSLTRARWGVPYF